MRVKRKIPSFIFGVSIGLLIGIGFFMFKLDDYFNKLKTAATSQIKVIEQPAKQEEKKEEPRSEDRFKIATKPATQVNYREVDSLIHEESVRVAKEEFLSVKNIKLIDLDKEQKDTLAGRLAGVNEEGSSGLFFVEFWRTPLNSKGYRMSKNRIILYGFSDFSSFNLYKVDDVYYLKSEDQVYKLSASPDFMPMERVSDTDLIAKMN